MKKNDSQVTECLLANTWRLNYNTNECPEFLWTVEQQNTKISTQYQTRKYQDEGSCDFFSNLSDHQLCQYCQ